MINYHAVMFAIIVCFVFVVLVELTIGLLLQSAAPIMAIAIGFQFTLAFGIMSAVTGIRNRNEG